MWGRDDEVAKEICGWIVILIISYKVGCNTLGLRGLSRYLLWSVRGVRGSGLDDILYLDLDNLCGRGSV